LLNDPTMLRFVSAGGLFTLLFIAWALSEDRRGINRRILFWGLGLQFMLGVLILLTPFGKPFFFAINAGFDAISEGSREGARFLFGNLTDFFLIPSAQVPGPNGMETIEGFPMAAVVGFKVLPTIIFVAALAAVLQYLGITQRVVGSMAWLMKRTMGTSGAETFSAALEVFMGIEAVSTLGSYVQRMTRSELFTVMTAYLATIAGSVMVAYANFGAEPGHLMAASLMGAPAAIVISKLMLPEREVPDTANKDIAPDEERAHNIFDAASQGASLGLMMALHVGAMLIVAIGMIHILDMIATGVTGVSLTILLGWLFRPFAFIMGVPWADIPEVARLLAVKTFFNEFVAYGDLQKLIADKTISPRAITISTYALCGFANPGSLGIMIGALTAMAPDRRADVAGLALRALIGGTLATFMTACIAGVLVGT
jgi:CNT family concentrative nucleoside transporter